MSRSSSTSSSTHTTHINLHVRYYDLTSNSSLGGSVSGDGAAVGKEGLTSGPEGGITHLGPLSRGAPRLAHLILARQKKANALTRDMLKTATSWLKEFHQDPDLRLLIISAEGKHFCGGADLEWLSRSAAVGDSEEQKRDVEILSEFFETLANLAIPVIALVQGTCAGGGVGLVSLCDSVICHNGAQFLLGEVRLGLVPAVIYPYLRQNLAPRRLRWWALSAHPLSAKDARLIGLCDHLYSHFPGKILAGEIAAFLSGGPRAQKLIKRQLSAPYELSAEAAREALELALSDRESAMGLSAFHDQQPPPWWCELSEDLGLIL